MLDEAQRKAVVQDYFDRINAGDAEGAGKLFSSEATVEDPVGAPPIHGEPELLAYFHRVVDEFQTQDRPGHLSGAQDGQHVAVPFRATIRNPQDPAGGRLAVDVVSSFRINGDGLIDRMRAYWGPTDVVPAGND